MSKKKSVVAVHGLNGHYLNTWTWQDPETKTNWLTDLLPGKLANARIMSFAYNANTFSDQSKGELMDHSVSLLDYLDMKRDEIQVSQEKFPMPGNSH
jgi:protein SERAC1